MKFEVVNNLTGHSHGVYDSGDEALGCAEYDRLTDYSINEVDDDFDLQSKIDRINDAGEPSFPFGWTDR